MITRFAPSPTGLLHRGHAYSAMLAYREAKAVGGAFLLRIEDIDTTRCREEYIPQMLEDLKWLGLNWPEPVRRQSEHFGDYKAALDKLEKLEVIYPCFCTRKEINAAATEHGPEGVIYPETCKGRSDADEMIKSGVPFAWRLDLQAAQELLRKRYENSNDWPLVWHDHIAGVIAAEPELLGDVVLARKDTPTSYHLSVVVDDALQGITHIIRGMDLFHTTHIHVILQKLLEVPTPTYHHHALLLDKDSKKFAKRDKSETLKSLREAGVNPESLFTLTP